MKPTNEDYFRWAVESLITRKWTVSVITKEQNKNGSFGCYVCNKRREKLFEVICEGGEPFWFGTSCAARLKYDTGIDLAKIIKGAQ